MCIPEKGKIGLGLTCLHCLVHVMDISGLQAVGIPHNAQSMSEGPVVNQFGIKEDI